MTAYSGDRKKKKASRVESVEATSFVESPGAKLQKARQARNIDIQAAAEQLNLKPSVVKALEADDYRGLPNATFVKGYLRNYAKFLDVSGDELMRLYEQNISGAIAEKSSPAPSRRPGHVSLKSASLALLVILMGAAIAWYWKTVHLESGRAPAFASPDTQIVKEPAVIGLSDAETSSSEAVVEEQAPEERSAPDLRVDEQLSLDKSADQPSGDEVSSSAGQIMVAVDQVAVKAQNNLNVPPGGSALPKEKPHFAESLTALAEAARGRTASPRADNAPVVVDDFKEETVLTGKHGRLDMVFTDECWVEVKDAFNKVIYANLKIGGSKLSLEGQPPFEVKFGNGKAVTVSFNGEPFPFDYSSSTNVARLNIGD